MVDRRAHLQVRGSQLEGRQEVHRESRREVGRPDRREEGRRGHRVVGRRGRQEDHREDHQARRLRRGRTALPEGIEERHWRCPTRG